MELHNAPEVYERIIHYDTEKEVQVRLTINNFRGIEYLHLRKYYLDFTEEWKPSISCSLVFEALFMTSCSLLASAEIVIAPLAIVPILVRLRELSITVELPIAKAPINFNLVSSSSIAKLELS